LEEAYVRKKAKSDVYVGYRVCGGCYGIEQSINLFNEVDKQSCPMETAISIHGFGV